MHADSPLKVELPRRVPLQHEARALVQAVRLKAASLCLLVAVARSNAATFSAQRVRRLGIPATTSTALQPH